MVLVVGGALLFWICVFLIYFTSQGISPVDFFLGGYEPYDPDLGKWSVIGAGRPSPPTTSETEQGGLVVEERWVLPEGNARAPYLERQVRRRDAATRVIVSVEPAVRVRRRRSRSVRG